MKPGFGNIQTTFGNRSSSYWNQRLYDEFSSLSINTAKWVVTNPNPLVAEFEQKGSALMMHTLFATNANSYANNIKSTDERTSGCWMFSLNDVRVLHTYEHGYAVTQNWFSGLMDSGFQNGIKFYRTQTDETVLSYSIIQGGVIKYTFQTTAENFCQPKIVITTAFDISVYFRINDIWVQQGTTQNYDIGSLSLFMASGGTYGNKTSMGEVYILNENNINVPNLPSLGVDIRNFGAIPDGFTDCSYAITLALASGGNPLIKDGTFIYTSSTKIPSNRDIIIKNAKLRQADNNVDSFFRNSDFENGNTNITIQGLGCAVLDGNMANNNDGYTAHGSIGAPIGADIHQYLSIVMCNVDIFSITGLTFVDFMHHNTLLQKASHGVIDNIYFSLITGGNYNQDGIDILWGCHNIAISNTRGRSGDDYIAISTGHNCGTGVPITNYQQGSIHDISFTDIYAYGAGQRGLFIGGEAGQPIYNISFENYTLKSVGAAYFCSSWLSVTLQTPTVDDIHDLTFNNINLNYPVYGTSYLPAISTQEAWKDITFTNIVDNRTVNPGAIYGNYPASTPDLENFSINGVFYPIPLFISGLVSDANKNKIVLTYDWILDDTSIPDVSAFTPSGGKTVTNIAINKTTKTVTLTVDSDYTNVDTITIDYTVPATNKLQGYLAGLIIALSDQAITNNVAASLPTNGLIARWEMNGDANDSINGYNLTVSGAELTTDSGSVANKAYTVGQDKYLYRNPGAESQLQTFSFCIKFKADSYHEYDVIVGNLNIGTYTAGWALIWISNKLRFWAGSFNGANQYVEIAMTDTTNWHTVVCSFSRYAASKNVQMSLDGAAPVTTNGIIAVGYTSAFFDIGKRSATTFFIGKVDACRLWDRELTDAEKIIVAAYYI